MPSTDQIENVVIGYKSGGPLPFTVEVSPKGQIYGWSTLAIRIIGIECDGENLSPFGSGIAINAFDASKLTPVSKRITYFTLASTLISVSEYNPTTGDYVADGYNIPPNFKELVITYSNRLPAGESGQVYKLRIAQGR